jgi:hypothetical protein
MLAEATCTCIAGVLVDVVISFGGDQEADRGAPRVDSGVEEDSEQEL